MTDLPQRILLLIMALMPVVACDARDAVMRKMNSLSSSTAGADSMGALPTHIKRIAVTASLDLVESSAAIMSPAQPDIVFTINDSGNDAVLFALDTTGRLRGRWSVSDARNNDWEAASRGPCTHRDTSLAISPSTSCLYFGDVGDNGAERKRLSIYQVEEPMVPGEMAEDTIASRKMTFRYPDGAHDVEAMYVGPDGTTYLITKRSLKAADGKRRPSLVFTVPATAWATRDTVVATLLDSLPIVPGSAERRQITDASLSSDSRFLAVRTYGQVYVFATDTATGRVLNITAPAVCNIELVEARHGEGITWYGTSGQLLLTSEGKNAPLHRITCPLPQRS